MKVSKILGLTVLTVTQEVEIGGAGIFFPSWLQLRCDAYMMDFASHVFVFGKGIYDSFNEGFSDGYFKQVNLTRNEFSIIGLRHEELLSINGGSSIWGSLETWYNAGRTVGYILGQVAGGLAKAMDRVWEKVDL